jgi:hypothetical protein
MYWYYIIKAKLSELTCKYHEFHSKLSSPSLHFRKSSATADPPSIMSFSPAAFCSEFSTKDYRAGSMFVRWICQDSRWIQKDRPVKKVIKILLFAFPIECQLFFGNCCPPGTATAGGWGKKREQCNLSFSFPEVKVKLRESWRPKSLEADICLLIITIHFNLF